MVPARYYTEHGMRNLQVSLPRSLRLGLSRIAREKEISLRAVYEEILTQFLRRQRRTTQKGLRQPYLATRRRASDSMLQMWLDAKLFQEIASLARRESVTKRAVAYTALSTAYEHTKRGHNHAKTTQSQAATHRRRR